MKLSKGVYVIWPRSDRAAKIWWLKINHIKTGITTTPTGAANKPNNNASKNDSVYITLFTIDVNDYNLVLILGKLFWHNVRQHTNESWKRYFYFKVKVRTHVLTDRELNLIFTNFFTNSPRVWLSKCLIK